MALSPLQIGLREGIVTLLRGAGLEPKVRQKHTRAEAADARPPADADAEGPGDEPGKGAGRGTGGGSGAGGTVSAGPGEGESRGGAAGPSASGQPEAPAAFDQDVVIRWELGGLRFAVWLYPDGAGVEEPGDDWWPFDARDFDDPRQLAEAVLDHVRDILAEAAESGG